MATGSNRAFTLIEMIVLIIIIAVISSVAVPAYSRFNATAKYQSVVRETMAMLDSARLTAIQSGADVTVQFDAQSATFMVITQPQDAAQDLPTAMQDAQDQPPPSVPRPYSLGEDVIVQDFRVGTIGASGDPSSGAQTGTLHFHEDGTSDGAQFVLRSASGPSVLFEVSAMTGHTTVHDGSQ